MHFQIGFSNGRADPLAARCACCALRHLTGLARDDTLTQQRLQPVFVALTQVNGTTTCVRSHFSTSFAVCSSP